MRPLYFAISSIKKTSPNKFIIKITLFQIAKEEWFSSWLASDKQLHFVLQSLNYSSLYDFTRGQFSLGGMDFWYWMQQPHVRKSMKLGGRRMSDGLEIYKAMIEDTMQSIRSELVEAMENYKVSYEF